MNNFFRLIDDFERHPKRLYARIHDGEIDNEPDMEGKFWQVFECVDADVVDENWKRLDDIKGRAHLPLYIIEMETKPLSFLDNILALMKKSLNMIPALNIEHVLNMEQTLWMEFSLEYESESSIQDGSKGREILLYGNLFSEPVTKYLLTGYPRYVSRELNIHLNGATGMDDLEDATEVELKNAIGDVDNNIGIAVFDVGQGNCNAVIGPDHNPILYYDFGGGVMRNTKTFPRSNNSMKFCFTYKPSVILSHWDWDHWSSVFRDIESLDTTWIAPRDKNLGIIHRVFLDELVERKNILIWPNKKLSELKVNEQVTIRKANGRSRNDSGLIMEVFDPTGQKSPALLMGDANYRRIKPDPCKKDWSVIVVPHHGAKMRPKAIPKCKVSPEYRLIYSAGEPNSYGHPSEITKTDYSSAGWSTGMVRYTYERRGDFGHIYWFWDPVTMNCSVLRKLLAGARPPCGTQCDLLISQL